MKINPLRTCLFVALLGTSSLFAQNANNLKTHGFTDAPQDLDYDQIEWAQNPAFSTPTPTASSNLSNENPWNEPASVSAHYGDPTTENPNALRSFVPIDGYFEYMGQRSLDDHNTRVETISAYLNLPIISPNSARWRDLHFNLTANMRVTWFNTSGQDVIDETVLYTMGFNGTMLYNLNQKGQIVFGLSPQISSDLDVLSSHDFFIATYLGYRFKVGENFRATLGLSWMPNYYSEDFLPFVDISWKFNPNWELRAKAARLSVVNVANPRFEWGPFIEMNSNVWTIKRRRETQQLRTRSILLGVGSQFVINPNGKTPIYLMGDLGFSVANKIEFTDKSGDHKIERYDTDTGLYARLGFELKY